MCSWKSCFHGAGGSSEAAGVVVDIVRKKRERRRGAMREAMVAVWISKLLNISEACSAKLEHWSFWCYEINDVVMHLLWSSYVLRICAGQ
jgi:hypothetical protein